ncbi:MAG: hypothetical protein ACK4JA_10520 [Parazoarcus communis]
MAALIGFTPQAQPLWTRDHLNIAPLDQLGGILFDERGVSEIDEGFTGQLAAHGPVAIQGRTLEGFATRGFAEDYYYRVHVRPNRIDLGNTMSVQTRDIEVWNAWPVSNTLTGINAINAEGMSLFGPAAPPTTFGPLESRLYVLSVTPNGPPVVNAAFHFAFELDASILRAVGRRIVGWMFAPDWSAPVIERLEWLTDVMESHAGHEQRVRLRAAPRRSLEYRLLLGSDSARVQLENRLISWQARVYGLPIWMDATASPNAISAGSVSLSVATAHRDFVAGGIVGLVHGLDAEFAQITAVTPVAIALNDPITVDWPAGTKIVPVRSARVQNDLHLSWLTDAITLAHPQFRLEDDWPIPAATEPVTYRGHPVLLTPPNWREDVEGEFGRKWRELDFLTGRRVIDDLTSITTQTRSHRWLLVGRAEIAAFRAWLAARAGKLKSFWLPSFQADLQVIAPVGGTDTFLTVDNRGYAEGPGAVVGRRDLLITTTSGNRFFRRISAATEVDAQREMVMIDGTFGATLQPHEFQRLSFMRLVRLDTDLIEIAHVTDEVAEVVLPLRSLRDDL